MVVGIQRTHHGGWVDMASWHSSLAHTFHVGGGVKVVEKRRFENPEGFT